LPSAIVLGLRNAARRPGRSLATVALLAFGVFLVASVVVHRRDTPEGLEERSSGSGGFALMGETALPILQDPSSEPGREALGLSAKDVEGVRMLLMRVHAGDDASCLNLAAPRTPRILGVDAAALAEREAFTFAPPRPEGPGSPWLALRADLGADVVPAIGDAASLQWQMHMAVGDELETEDEVGRPFRLRIVGAVTDSVLQGSLIIDEARFRERYPSVSGYRQLFLDVEGREIAEVSDSLGRRLADLGLELEPTAERLSELAAVQNTYIDIFQVLGSLGLLLGTLGLGLAVLQSTLERRSELALLRALGLGSAFVRRLVSAEHLWLFAAGLLVGGSAAALALAPTAWAAQANPITFSSSILMSVFVLAGIACVWIAGARGVSAADLPALRAD
jgi:hypothetical protein